MKKIIVLILLVTASFVAVKEEVVSFVKINFIATPIPYYQQRQEFFEKLSKEYYGTANYGEELDNINRTFKITESTTEQVDLIIPNFDAINRLKQRRTMAAIEDEPYTHIVARKPQLLKNNSAGQGSLKRVDPLKGSTIILLVSIIVISTIISLMGYFKYRRNKRNSASLRLADNEPIITDDRILVDFDISTYEEERLEPDKAYLNTVA